MLGPTTVQIVRPEAFPDSGGGDRYTKPTATSEAATFHPVAPKATENQYRGRLYL